MPIKNPTANVNVSHVSTSRAFLRVTLLSACRTLIGNGNAPINDCPEGATGGTEQCVKEGEADSGLFGGADPEDDSGSLRYVVVKYAGSNVDPENQLNGIAFQGTGSGTQAAILARLVRKVCTIEIVRPLGETATKLLKKLGYDNVHVRIGDGGNVGRRR